MNAVPDAAVQTVRRYARVASAYQTLTPPFTHWVDPCSGCVVAYVTVRGSPWGGTVWMVAGEPIGPAPQIVRAARRFEAEARAHRSSVIWFGIEYPDLLESAGACLVIGAQPVWRAGEWDERLAQKASLRAQVHRAHNKGVSVEDASGRPLLEGPDLHRVLREWIARRGLPPLSFLADPHVLDHLIDRRVYVARYGGRVVAYLVLAPIPARGAWHVEWIIRAADAPNGTASLLIDAVCRSVSPDSLVTLGLVPLSSQAPLSPEPPPPAVRALLTWTRAHARRFYNFEGLERFKAKFLPDVWEPIYLATSRPRVSIATLYAVADAFAGPRSPARLVGRAVLDAAAAEGRDVLGWISSRGT